MARKFAGVYVHVELGNSTILACEQQGPCRDIEQSRDCEGEASEEI